MVTMHQNFQTIASTRKTSRVHHFFIQNTNEKSSRSSNVTWSSRIYSWLNKPITSSTYCYGTHYIGNSMPHIAQKTELNAKSSQCVISKKPRTYYYSTYFVGNQ
eukprot:112308_1